MHFNAIEYNLMQWKMQWNAMKCNSMQFMPITAIQCNLMKLIAIRYNSMIFYCFQFKSVQFNKF